MLTNLELWNVLTIVAGVVSVKLCELARRKEAERKQANELRLGLIIGLYWDAQIAIFTGVVTLALLLAEIIGVTGVFFFVLLCSALLMVGPRMGHKLVMAFNTPRVRKRARRRRYHATGTYNPAVGTFAIRNKKP